MCLRRYGHKCLGSFSPCRLPAELNGWHGYPPMSPCTFPRNSRAGKVLRFEKIGALSILPSSIFATKLAWTKASISTLQTTLRSTPARLSPSSIPPYPVQKLIMFWVLSTSNNLPTALHLLQLNCIPDKITIRFRAEPSMTPIRKLNIITIRIPRL